MRQLNEPETRLPLLPPWIQGLFSLVQSLGYLIWGLLAAAWLLRRKQREYHGDGRVYFYEKPPKDEETTVRHLLLKANGVEIRTLGAAEGTDYDAFYAAAIEDIRQTVEQNRR